MRAKYLFLLFFLASSSISAIAQKNMEKRLLYCREDLELTGLFPLSKSYYIVSDYGELKYAGRTSNIRNLVLRLIGKDGLSIDSLVFQGSIKEVVPISESRMIANGYSSSFFIEIVNGKLVKQDSTKKLTDLQWLLVDEERTELKGKSLKKMTRASNKNLKKLRGINGFGVYGDWAVFSKENSSKKAKDKQLLYSVIHTKTKEVISINEIEKVLSHKWKALDMKFSYWRRTVFFIGDKIYFSSPDTGKCYQFDINTKEVSFFSYPSTKEGLWFFTYDYVKKKQYLIKHNQGVFELFYFSGPDEKLVRLKETKSFHNYMFNDAILLPEEEKGNQGKILCFYVLPIYEETREWD